MLKPYLDHLSSLFGSGIETLFVQLEHCTSENLTGHNYGSTKAVLLTIDDRAQEPNRNTTIGILHSVFLNLNLDGNQLHLVSA